MAQATCIVDDCEKSRTGASRYCSMHRARIARHGSPDGCARRKPVEERVLARVDSEDDGCWPWRGYVDPSNGYGVLRTRDAGKVYAHRVAYEAAFGPIPHGMAIDHICHNRMCARPDHLRLVTPKQNNENHNGSARVDSSTGFRGASLDRNSNLYRARVKHFGVEYLAGWARTAGEAGEMARQLRLALHTHNDMDRA